MPSTLMFPEASPTYFRDLAEGHRLVRAIRDAAEADEAASYNHEFGYVDWINPDMISEDVLISRSADTSGALDAAVDAALAHPLARRILAAQRIPCATADDRIWVGYRVLHRT